ncbi:MAG: cytochrome c family protein [Bacteriovoracaceae bacterium]
MNNFIKLTLSLTVGVLPVLAFSFEASEYFDKKCSSCHSIGQGDDVGPDLKGVTERRQEKWLIEFIKDSEKVINSGDSVANELFAKFKNKKMPAQEISDDEIKALLVFIKTGQGAGGAVQFRSATMASPYDIEMGKKLFIGNVPFKNGGPACLSCHGAGDNLEQFGGGSLGPDLVKTSYTGYLDKGMNKVLSKISFPTMAEVYSNSPLTEQENFYLRSFLMSENSKYEKEKDTEVNHGSTQNKFVLVGLGLATFGLMGIDTVWRRRRKKSKKPY